MYVCLCLCLLQQRGPCARFVVVAGLLTLSQIEVLLVHQQCSNAWFLSLCVVDYSVLRGVCGRYRSWVLQTHGHIIEGFDSSCVVARWLFYFCCCLLIITHLARCVCCVWAKRKHVVFISICLISRAADAAACHRTVRFSLQKVPAPSGITGSSCSCAASAQQ